MSEITQKVQNKISLQTRKSFQSFAISEYLQRRMIAYEYQNKKISVETITKKKTTKTWCHLVGIVLKLLR